MHILKPDPAGEPELRQQGFPVHIHHFRPFGHELPDPLRGAQGLLQLAVEVCETGHGPPHEGGVDHEGREVPETQVPFLHQPHAVPDHEDDGSEQREQQEGYEGSPDHTVAYREVNDLPECIAVPADLEPFVGKCLHIGDALQGLLHHRIGIGKLVLRLPGKLPDPLAEENRDHDDHRDHGQHDQREFRGNIQDEDDACDKGQDAPQDLRKHEGHRILDL